MNKKSSKLSKENKIIIAIVILITIIFAFNDNKPDFSISNWLLNFVYVLLLSIISFLVVLLGYSLASKYFHTKTTIGISQLYRAGIERGREIGRTGFRKYRLEKTPLKKIPLGIIIAILVTLFSNGKFFFTAFYSLDTDTKRIGYRFKNTTNLEHALIATAGIAASFILLFIYNVIGIEKGVTIITWLITWSLLPIANLPGGKIFMGSRTLWILVVTFSIFALLLVPILPTILTIVLALIFALALTIFYFKQIEYKT